MKKQHKNHSQFLVNIRRNKRLQQTTQIKNSLRFSNEINSLLAQDDNQQGIQLAQQDLQKLLEEGQYEILFDSIIKGSIEDLQCFDKLSYAILTSIFQRLSHPKAVLALHNLCIKSDLFLSLILEESKIVDITNQIKKLPIGSKQQNVYLSCLSSILEFKQLNRFIKMQQFEQLFYHQIEYIVYQRYQQKLQDNLAIRVVKCLIDISDEKYHFGEDFIVQFLEFYWKAKNTINHINIYMSAISLVKAQIYKKSITILISIIRIVIRGRNILPLNIDKEIQSKTQIMVDIFQFYNNHMQKMQQYGTLFVDGMKIDLTLHHFMLECQIDFFYYQPNQTFLQFVIQFCKNGQSELIVERWEKIGLLGQIIDHMLQSAQICYLSLKICLTLLGRQGTISNAAVGRQMKNLGLLQAIQQVLQLYYCKNVVELALTLSSYLQII